MEAIILTISWHYKAMKMRKGSKAKHVEKKIIISRNRNNNFNSNNNDLKDEQSNSFENKKNLIWTGS